MHDQTSNEGFFSAVRTLFPTRRHLWYLGLACPQVWLNYMFQSLNGYAPLSTEIFYATRGLFLLFIAIVFFVRKFPYRVTWSFLSLPIVVIMTIAPFLASYPAFVPPQMAVILAAVFGGIGIVWSYLPHVHVYSRLKTKQIAGYVLLSFALASVVRFPLSLLPFEAALLLTAPLPFLGIFMGKKALTFTESEPKSHQDLQSENLRKLTPVAIELAIYGIVVGMIRLSNEGEQYSEIASNIFLGFRTVFPLIIFWWIVSRHRSISISRLCQIALICVITALLIISVVGGAASPLAAAAASCARTAIIFLLWLTLALLAQRSSYHPYVVFGIGWSLYMLSIVSGMLIGEALGAASLFTDSLVLNLIYFLVVTTVFILLMRDEDARKFIWKADDQSWTADLDAMTDPLVIDSRCTALGEQYHLTKREVEVMQLICKGRSKSYIAEDLSLSEHTVRGYAKNLYAKLDIHSKQELLSLLETM